ncbi:hypothetical protein FOL47_009123 [Perkinsus chesapeaki]|uniref:Uncharacterized protein n=1 Tax=Perkinsus chesapeaki TaxID=330153 RepID=A0A7J6LAA1_PERCH|nr:hypothetical protein FOL47_009123 [Perkinsus chesapeaki]
MLLSSNGQPFTAFPPPNAQGRPSNGSHNLQQVIRNPVASGGPGKVPKIDLTHRLIFPGCVETPRQPSVGDNTVWAQQARKDATKLQLARLEARVKAEQQASELLFEETESLEEQLRAQQHAADDFTEELGVVEEAARVALSESILLQRKLCEICRHLEVRAAFEESISNAAGAFCKSQFASTKSQFGGPPPSSRSVVHNRWTDNSYPSIDFQSRRSPRDVSGSLDADDEFWASLRHQINIIDHSLGSTGRSVSDSSNRPGPSAAGKGFSSSYASVVREGSSRSVCERKRLPLKCQLQNALESSSIMCARTALLISKLDGWFDDSTEPELGTMLRNESIDLKEPSSAQGVGRNVEGAGLWDFDGNERRVSIAGSATIARDNSPGSIAVRMLSDTSSSSHNRQLIQQLPPLTSVRTPSTGDSSVNSK